MKEDAIVPREGFRILDRNELVEEGDEYFYPAGGYWVESKNWEYNSGKQSPSLTYCRKADSGAGTQQDGQSLLELNAGGAA